VPDPEPAPKPPVNYVKLADEVATYWQDVAKRVGDGLKAAATDAKADKYTAGRFLDDVAAFWKALGGDMERGVNNWKTYVVDRGSGT